MFIDDADKIDPRTISKMASTAVVEGRKLFLTARRVDAWRLARHFASGAAQQLPADLLLWRRGILAGPTDANVRDTHAGEQGMIRLGFVGSATFRLLPAILPEFRRRFPRAILSLTESSTQEIVRNVMGDRLDLGLVRLPLLEAASIRVAILENDELSAALPSDHRLAGRASLDLAQLKTYPFILQSRISILHSLTLKACAEAGFVPVVTQEAIQLNTLLSLVGSGLGVALVPAGCVEQAPRTVRLLPLSRAIPTQSELVAARHERRKLITNFWSVATGLPQATSTLNSRY